ncbi:MAG: 16S rRNA (adenine(1518)-N(6)/adenine(1519)-N(6))-dimethyltransferase RsmA [Clostridiales bacterium]|nr:16S rRNA (adenine(1518)-N(6)/adenine(1519)-N(6))-dimethyltransferase RsmA [Clostridiales bacterium]
MKLYSPAVIMALKEKHKFRISKSLGQNFLVDQNIINKIIESAEIGEGDLVLEIGAGMGVLTAAAAEKAARVVAVEIDKNLLPVLKDALDGYGNIDIVNGDVLKMDLSELVGRSREGTAAAGAAAAGSGKTVVIGNLPYYITTPAIMKVLEEKMAVERIVVMVQKEVADRIGAKPGTKAYGAITAAINYYCTISVEKDVPRDVFFPRPNVDSAILRLDVRKEPPVSLVDEKAFFACIKAGFGKRRKTLQNALAGLYGLGKQEVGEALQSAAIDPSRRAETLSIEEFAALANSIRHTANSISPACR